MNNNQECTIEQIKVMQAYVDGKIIQYCLKYINGDSWRDCNEEDPPIWDWVHVCYRVKLTPRIFYMIEMGVGTIQLIDVDIEKIVNMRDKYYQEGKIVKATEIIEE